MPAGVGPGQSFSIQVAAPQPIVAATAVPVGAPASSAPQAQVVDGDSDAPANAGFAEKAVLEAKIVRQIAQERNATDLVWGIGFLVCFLIEYGLGFYEISNAVKEIGRAHV